MEYETVHDSTRFVMQPHCAHTVGLPDNAAAWWHALLRPSDERSRGAAELGGRPTGSVRLNAHGQNKIAFGSQVKSSWAKYCAIRNDKYKQGPPLEL